MRARRFFTLTMLLSLITGLMLGGVGTAQAAGGPRISGVVLTRGPFAMTVTITTDVDAVVTALLSTHPLGTPGPVPLADSSEDYTTAHAFGFGSLTAGTPYYLTLVASDRIGGFIRLERTFTTVVDVDHPGAGITSAEPAGASARSTDAAWRRSWLGRSAGVGC